MKRYSGPIYLKGDFSDTEDFSKPNNYLPLPTPQTAEPYRLNLADYIEELDENEFTFHLVGDTGSYKDIIAQQRIGNEIAKNAFQENSSDFMYHLGDVVYHHGEECEYAQQFFTPYERFPGPIFAIAGNHDGDINPATETPYESLDAFMKVFCNPERKILPFSGGSKRKSISQPYIYWTMESPLATIIGLYGNVAKFGLIDDEQRAWFIEELRRAGTEQDEKAIIITVHQSPFSTDTNHGSSLYMINFLESAYKEAGVIPDMVFSGHVHNYQRFHKRYENGKLVPYIVAGAGGYAILHPIAELDNPRVSGEHPFFEDVKLKAFCDDKHGFMKMNIKRSHRGLDIKLDYFTIANIKDSEELETKLFDSLRFSLDRYKKEAGYLV